MAFSLSEIIGVANYAVDYYRSNAWQRLPISRLRRIRKREFMARKPLGFDPVEHRLARRAP